jgi:hypothetical protein
MRSVATVLRFQGDHSSALPQGSARRASGADVSIRVVRAYVASVQHRTATQPQRADLRHHRSYGEPPFFEKMGVVGAA